MKKLIPLLVTVFSVSSFASQKVETRIKTSDSNNSTTLSYRYLAPEGALWSSEVSVTGTRSKVKDTSAETEITREIQWINTWDLTPTWFAELAVGGSNTKVNDIRTANADVTFGQMHEDLYFFNWSLTAGVNSIKQQKGLTSTSDTLKLSQSKLGVQLGIDPLEWLTVSIFSTSYDYDKDVDQELLALQSEAAVQRYGTAFSDQLSSLIEKEAGLTLGFKLSDSWKLSFTGTQTQDAPQPKVKGKSTSAKLFHRFSPQWDGSLFVGSTQYDSSSQNPETKYQYVGLSAGFSF